MSKDEKYQENSDEINDNIVNEPQSEEINDEIVVSTSGFQSDKENMPDYISARENGKNAVMPENIGITAFLYVRSGMDA